MKQVEYGVWLHVGGWTEASRGWAGSNSHGLTKNNARTGMASTAAAEIAGWTCEDVQGFLVAHDFQDVASTFLEENIESRQKLLAGDVLGCVELEDGRVGLSIERCIPEGAVVGCGLVGSSPLLSGLV